MQLLASEVSADYYNKVDYSVIFRNIFIPENDRKSKPSDYAIIKLNVGRSVPVMFLDITSTVCTANRLFI